MSKASPYIYPGIVGRNDRQQQNRIIDAVCKHFDVDIDYIRFKCRDRRRVRIRNIAIYILYHDWLKPALSKVRSAGYDGKTEMLKSIVNVVGLTDRTSAYHNVIAAQNMIDTEDDFKADVETIRGQLNKADRHE